jgi:uncharacterized membrane protein YhaH (DUF805 family)
MKKYFYSNGNEDHGPYTLNELRYGKISDVISEDTLIWAEGSLVRRRAAEVIELNKVSVNVTPGVSQSHDPEKADEKEEFIPPPLPKEVEKELDNPERQSEFVSPPMPEEDGNIFILSNLVTVYRKSFTLKGRATRLEFWGFQLFYWLFLVIGFFFSLSAMSVVFFIISIPAMFSIQVRRLHDVGWSGWWLLLNMIPTVGSVFLLIVYCFDSTPGSNSYDTRGLQNKGRVSPVFVSEFD